MSRRFDLAIMVATLVAYGCDSPVKPTPPSVSVPAITCPVVPIVAQSSDGNPVPVVFPKPLVSGGVEPVTTTCTPETGSAFPLGSTSVTCTALDARQQAASCSFAVSVSKLPRLRATRFVAFGDSITEGVTATCIRVTPFMTFSETMLVLPRAANDPWAYPNVLQSLLRERYVAQDTSVLNRGVAGETLDAGVARLPSVLAQDAPEVLLLQEGANDLNQGRSATGIATALRTMVRTANARAVPVFVGTLLPQRPVGTEGSCRGFAADAVAAANDQIRAMAANEGAPLVDLYQAFGSVPGNLIGPDGLHPNEAGYQKIADTFFAAIRERVEN